MILGVRSSGASGKNNVLVSSGFYSLPPSNFLARGLASSHSPQPSLDFLPLSSKDPKSDIRPNKKTEG